MGRCHVERSPPHRSLSPTPNEKKKKKTIPAHIDTSKISEQPSVSLKQLHAVLAAKPALEAQPVVAQATIQIVKKVDMLETIVKSTQ